MALPGVPPMKMRVVLMVFLLLVPENFPARDAFSQWHFGPMDFWPTRIIREPRL
jgi:hypothetical protein